MLLPEIIPLEEAPGYVIGVVNLRGQIVPVMDLNLCFGRSAQPHRLEDCVVVLEWAGSVVGILVNEVHTVRDVAPDEIVPVPSYGTEVPSDAPFIMGLLQSGEQIVMLLHLENLRRQSQSLSEWSNRGSIAQSPIPNAFCPDAAPQERAIFRARARSLSQPPESPYQTGLLPHAVVRLGEELLGIELQSIREFADLHTVAPVPCCPEHIVGQMSLRGDLITLIEIAGTLRLQSAYPQCDRKVVVVNSSELSAGILVDEVLDILYLNAADIVPAPARARGPGREYLEGTASYGSQMLKLLDLPALLRQESLMVNEKP